MKKRKSLYFALTLLCAFAVWTLLILRVDVRAVGPNGSRVGFAGINLAFHRLTGTNLSLYAVTDWLGLVPVAFAFGFAVLGLCQWIKRRSIFKIDRTILILGGYYVLVIGLYLFFEEAVVNYRPILIDGRLEASYPSSTTLLTASVMPTAALQLNLRIKNAVARRTVCVLIYIFTAFMIIGRLISGVHWLTDIIGGLLLSAGAVLLYAFSAEKHE